MSQKTGTRRRTWKERALSLLLAAVMTAGLLPGTALPASAEHWADTYMDQLVDWGVLRADQTADPDAALSRAEFMAIINRAYGYTETGPIPFEDVLPTDWFYDDVSIAYTAGYMAGTSDVTASPHDTLTREQAVCILGRNMMLKDTPGENLAFADSRNVSDWARGTIKTAVDNYIISGYPDNTFQPKAAISKGQMAVLVTQCVGSPIQQSGSYELGGVFGNVTITAPGVTLRNTTISGDLYVSGGVGLGGIKLENVNVLGRIIVSGTGESQGGDASVVMRNVTAEEMLVDNMRNRTVTIRADGITDIARTVVRTNAYLEDNNTDSEGLMNIELDGESGTRLTLAGRIKDVVNKTPNSIIQVAKGTVASLTVDEAAVNSTVQLDRSTEVKEMNLDVATNVTGDGDIGELNVNSAGSVVAMLPDKIYIRPGLTANIAGVIMDHLAAEEGSLDPRLLSGYPAAKDITPTGLRADFAGNKKGTVYWAVSNITDGSVSEDDLITPPSYGSIAIRNGSVEAPSGGGEVSAQITGLTVGGSYYLSAILVDDQGNRSPVKVVSFATPDNSVPAFGEGYPYMSFIGKANDYETLVTAQVAVMATKTCRMYYAVLPAGAAAPTTDELRSASVSSNLGYGVVELEKNHVWDGDQAIIISRRLEEKKDYVLYTWLTDGVNSSEVAELAFSTPDVTAPVFVVHPHENGDVQDTSIPMAATLNENGTIYWVVVESGAAYPLPNPQNDKENEADGRTARLDSDYAKLQVANGMNAVSSGRVNATANTQATMNITGLEAEKSYDLYYLAQDTAGNYTVQVYKLQGGIRTKDVAPPTVRQFFTRVDPQDSTRPMRDTSIVLEFSENIRLGGSGGKDLLSMYEATQTGTTSEKEAAQAELLEALRNNISLYVRRNGRPYLVVRGGQGVDEDDWAIDFSKAQIANSGGKVQITFPSGEDSLRLNSGATYYFEVNTNTTNPITDLSGHTMEPSPINYDTPEDKGHSLPQFTVVFARVDMTSKQFELSDLHWPQAIAEENNRNHENGVEIGDYQVDFKFRLMPDSTETVADGISYDLLLWTDKNIEYDLYYRVVTESGRTLTAERDENGYRYGMPNMPAVPDDNGWVKLGNSGRHYFGSESNGRSGKRLHYTFNGCTTPGAELPNLNKLASRTEDGEEIYYDFAVSVRKVSNESNPNTWGETVNFYVDVAAGYSSNLSDKLSDNITPGSWQEFLEDGLNGGGGESIGSADEYENDSRELHMRKEFKDSVQPQFTGNSPRFVPDSQDETKMTMNLALTRPGTIYYVVGLAHNHENVEPSDTSQWVSSIITKVNKVNIRPEMVPGSGADRDNENPPMPELDENFPDKGQIQSPDGDWINSNGVVAYGNVRYPGTSYIDVPLNDLKPNRTYYVYFVITGTGVVPSDVEIYKFKTNPVTRPEITISGERLTGKTVGHATLETDINSMLTYKVYTQQSAQNGVVVGDLMKKKLTDSDVLNSAYLGMVPSVYKEMTVYDALKEEYSYALASQNGSVTTGIYFPSDGTGDPSTYNKKYSVFDIYASDGFKDKLKALLESTGGETPADMGQNQALTGGRPISGADVVQPSLTYYVIAMARKNPEDLNTEQSPTGIRYSFMGGEIKLGDQDPPYLINAQGNFTMKDDGNGTNVIEDGYIILTFDKEVHFDKKKIDEVADKASLFQSTTGIDTSKIKISIMSDNYTTVYLPLQPGARVVSVSTAASAWTNSYGAGGGYFLNIYHNTSRWPDQTSGTNEFEIVVTWDRYRNTITGYGGIQPVVTQTPSVTNAVSSFSVNGTTTGSVENGTVTLSFDNPLYLGENTPVTSAQQLLNAASEVKGIDVQGSSVVNTEDAARVTLKLQKGAKDVSLKIDGGTLTSSSGAAAEETLTVQMEKRTESNMSGAKINRHYVDVKWGEEEWSSVEK